MDSLEQTIADAQARLEAAVADRTAAMHAPVVGTPDGEMRIMVLRAVGPALSALRFHTDARSPKVMTVATHGRASVLAYDPVARVQLRLSGPARIEQAGPTADAAWDKAAAFSRRCYLAEAGPGAPLDAPGSALPADLLARRPTLAETEAGRAAFAVLLVEPETLDWLRLDAHGGVRARFVRGPQGWEGGWTAP
ncbi:MULTISPECIES: flavin-binding protein [unclassified Sphingomonas]|uniref:flavin-binding protein n=1 Tax=Novosphingobium rhizosphaerae TaxID=1551649 RepID=UPI0015C9A104